jgi:hypothetical protein
MWYNRETESRLPYDLAVFADGQEGERVTYIEVRGVSRTQRRAVASYPDDPTSSARTDCLASIRTACRPAK